MNDRTEEDEKMPEEMSALFLHREGDDADGVNDAAGQDEAKERKVFPDHPGQEEQPAPAEHHKEHRLEHAGTARAEDGDKDDAGQDQHPLHNTADRTGLTAPEKEPKRCKGTADQQVNGYIVKTPPEPLDFCAPFKGMIQAGHEKHHQEA